MFRSFHILKYIPSECIANVLRGTFLALMTGQKDNLILFNIPVYSRAPLHLEKQICNLCFDTQNLIRNVLSGFISHLIDPTFGTPFHSLKYFHGNWDLCLNTQSICQFLTKITSNVLSPVINNLFLLIIFLYLTFSHFLEVITTAIQDL